MSLAGYISSIYTGSCVDGTGLRCVVFFSGCNLKCPFCHNPETLFEKGTEYSVEELTNKLLRYLPYLKNGGITLSGGEPFMQAEFCIELIKNLKKYEINIAIETNGHILNSELVNLADTIIIDIKNYDIIEKEKIAAFLGYCRENKTNVKITNVIINGINDNLEKLKELKSFLKPYQIKSVEFLPFKKLCVSKYESLNKPFLYLDIPETTEESIKEILKTYSEIKT